MVWLLLSMSLKGLSSTCAKEVRQKLALHCEDLSSAFQPLSVHPYENKQTKKTSSLMSALKENFKKVRKSTLHQTKGWQRERRIRSLTIRADIQEPLTEYILLRCTSFSHTWLWWIPQAGNRFEVAGNPPKPEPHRLLDLDYFRSSAYSTWT